MPSMFPEGDVQSSGDNSQRSLQKIVGLLAAGGGGGGTITTAEVWAASGVPAHTPTIDRQIYLNTDDGTQYNWYSSAWH